jgi:pyruvate/2-oxoglutarate dehydrogenase complex dihydrolipoamide dehydrogenase (E3) component
VDERLAATADCVWAMGECAGSPQFTHVAFDDFRVVHDNLHGGNSTTSGRLVPYCIYTDPELARVGCNESEASELMAAVQTAMVGRIPYTALHSAIYAHPTMAEGLTFLLRNTLTLA